MFVYIAPLFLYGIMRIILTPNGTGLFFMYPLWIVGDKNDRIKVFEIESLRVVLEITDFVLITLPLTEKTKGLIGRDELSYVKPNSFLINISRGVIVDEEALYTALKEKKIAGAALDVWWLYSWRSTGIRQTTDGGQLASRFDFQELKNVVMTPHRAAYVKESIEASARAIADNIQ